MADGALHKMLEDADELSYRRFTLDGRWGVGKRCEHVGLGGGLLRSTHGFRVAFRETWVVASVGARGVG